MFSDSSLYGRDETMHFSHIVLRQSSQLQVEPSLLEREYRCQVGPLSHTVGLVINQETPGISCVSPRFNSSIFMDDIYAVCSFGCCAFSYFYGYSEWPWPSISKVECHDKCAFYSITRLYHPYKHDCFAEHGHLENIVITIEFVLQCHSAKVNVDFAWLPRK